MLERSSEEMRRLEVAESGGGRREKKAVATTKENIREKPKPDEKRPPSSISSTRPLRALLVVHLHLPRTRDGR